ncbi:MAG: hypothetical protein H6983_00175 [Ectothiorhodospiraceae bacterium]|nr:hypothetical protein [Ectothiorhodospiraceae bacterium]
MSILESRTGRRPLAALVLLAGLLASHQAAAVVALDSVRGIGNQSYTGALGMDFDVLAPIAVTHLGAFDSGQDGFGGASIAVGIFDRGTQALVTGLSASIDSGDGLTGQSRYEDIADIVLGVGQYSIVAHGFGSANPNGNAGSTGSPPTIDDGGGLIQFVGTARFLSAGSLVWPTVIDGGPPNRYDAGTFQFTAAPQSVPSPAPLALMLAGLLALRSRRRTRSG